MNPRSVTAVAHAKVNLHLGCGQAREDGYHELVTVFQSLSLHDRVTLTSADEPSLTITSTVPGDVPADRTNLAWRAVEKVAAHAEPSCPVSVHIDKSIPIAGGMAGGSADAAAALVAANELFDAAVSDLYPLAQELGADVPFGLMGGTALGVGRGDELAASLSRGQYHWAVVTSDRGLSTPSVFRKLDELRDTTDGLEPHMDAHAVTEAIARGDVQALAAAMHNDLQPAALSLRPDLRTTLDVGKREGALSGIVSGSGPTCVFLCEDADHALDVAAAVAADVRGARGFTATGPALGARVVED